MNKTDIASVDLLGRIRWITRKMVIIIDERRNTKYERGEEEREREGGEKRERERERGKRERERVG